MLPTDFPQRNFVYQKPESMTDEQCMSLPVWRGFVPNGNDSFPTILSCWRLSKEDLEEIQKTGCVWLSITGTAMPPVSVFTENPFENVKPDLNLL